MYKTLIGSIIGSIVGVIVGGFITLFVNYKVQKNQFEHDREEHNDIYRSLLDALSGNMQDIDDRLKKIKQNSKAFDNNFKQYFGFEYFDTDILKAVLFKLMDVKLFPENKNVFNRVMKLINNLLSFNVRIKHYENLLLSGEKDPGSNNSLQSNKQEILMIIDNILDFIESNYGQSNFSLMKDIENIKNQLT